MGKLDLPMPRLTSGNDDGEVTPKDLLQSVTTVVSYSIMGVAFVAGMRYGLGHRMEEGMRHFASGRDSGAAHLENGLKAIAEALKKH